jgi:hypothetical protein
MRKSVVISNPVHNRRLKFRLGHVPEPSPLPVPGSPVALLSGEGDFGVGLEELMRQTTH